MVLEKTLESPLDCKDIQPVNPKRKSVLNIHWKVWCWSWNSNTLATWYEGLTHLKRPWCWKRLKVGGEGDDRRWDGWMASPTRWTWVWASSRIWWWTGKTGVLQSTGSQRAGHDWVTELNQIYTIRDIFLLILFLNKQFVYFNELCLFNLFLYCGDFCFLFKTSWPPQGWEGIFCFY